MNLFGNILLGLIILIAGVLILRYNYQVSNNLPLSFAERYLGSSYTAWKFLGVFIVIAGLTVMFGVADNIIGWLLSPLTNIIGGQNV